MGAVAVLYETHDRETPSLTVEAEVQRPKRLTITSELVARIHCANVATDEVDATATIRSERLLSSKRRAARLVRAEILRVVMAECALRVIDVAAILDLGEKAVREMLTGARPFEGELLLPAGARAMFLRKMGERHEQLRSSGR